MGLLQRLRRHPLPMSARFGHSLVLTYAFPQETLRRLLPRGLELDRYGEHGFAAVALVQTEEMRPSFLPRALGRNFFLSGYRVFARARAQPSLRGLGILRSDTDSRGLAVLGNVLTHYGYRHADVELTADSQRLCIRVRTAGAEADLDLVADLATRPAPLPEGSPFPDLAAARRFAGPLPYTFDFEPETGSLVLVRGVRSDWDPQPVAVEVRELTFFDDLRFGGADPLLANAFHVSGVDYRWERGRVVAL